MKEQLQTMAANKNFHSLSQQIISSSIGFVSFVLLARYFDKENFGMWLLYITACTFADMLRIGLTQTAVVRFLSGASETEQKGIIGSNWLINLFIAGILSVLVFLLSKLFQSDIENSGYFYFFKFYPLYVFLNLQSINSLSILQAKQRFDRILFIKSFESGMFLLFLISTILYFRFDIEEIIIGQLAILGISSLICTIKGWDGINKVIHANPLTNKKILNFGKFSSGTLIGTSLLRSADTFIIALSPVLGPQGVAIYGIPLKLIEIIDIPLRSFSATLFPNLSKSSIEQNMNRFKKQYYTNAGALTFAVIPICVLGFIFASDLMVFIGGKEYESSSIIFKIFAIYGLLMPIDRFTGIALDSLNKPDKNFYKMLIMIASNITGDLIAVFVFESLLMVAIVSILFTIVGLVVGLYFLNNEIQLDKSKIFREGINFYVDYLNKLKRLYKTKT